MTFHSEQDFMTFMRAGNRRVETRLDALLPAPARLPARLHQAMRYVVFNGGKRVRPLLVYATGRACGISAEHSDDAASAVELIHSYSLVHDDLPAMDDDELRRGKPTCHIAFDEATAILVGDALQSLAFEVLAHSPVPISAERKLQMIEILARASGSHGMAGGQSLDIEATGQDMSLPELEVMHIHKTGALIRASVQLGALCGDVSAEQRHLLDRFAKAIGLAFQVQDDILDHVSDTDTLGKTQGKDALANKPTYVSLLGLEEARRKAHDLLHQAVQALNDFGRDAETLRQLAHYVIDREH